MQKKMPTEHTEDTEGLRGWKAEIRSPFIATISVRVFGLTRLFFRVLCVFRGRIGQQELSRTTIAFG